MQLADVVRTEQGSPARTGAANARSNAPVAMERKLRVIRRLHGGTVGNSRTHTGENQTVSFSRWWEPDVQVIASGR
jgi:hypothetical protein